MIDSTKINQMRGSDQRSKNKVIHKFQTQPFRTPRNNKQDFRFRQALIKSSTLRKPKIGSHQQENVRVWITEQVIKMEGGNTKKENQEINLRLGKWLEMEKRFLRAW